MGAISQHLGLFEHCFTSDHFVAFLSLRMGTKVECKNYLPGYIDMADSSVNSNGNLLPFRYHENRPSRHISAKLTIISANGSIDYDKELLKRTMLEHEATFRKQVYELHRLYKTQKDLMAQFQREESNSSPSYLDTSQPSYLSQTPSDNLKTAWQAEHDLKQSSVYLMKGTGSQYSANGTPLKNNNVRSSKKMLDLQLPAHVYADDDEVEILDEKPSKSMPWTSGSVLGGNAKLNHGSSEGSSHVERSWITDIKPPHSSVINTLNKQVEESSYIRTTDFCGVGISTAQNQHHLSGGVKINDQCAGKLSGANEEIWHNNSFRSKMDEPNTSMAWLNYKQNGIESSMRHYMVGRLTFNQSILARPGFNDELNSPWQSINPSYMSRSHYDTIETTIAKNVLSSGISMDSVPNTSHRSSLNIHEEPHHQKHPLLQGFMKDIDLNNAPLDTTQDATDAWVQGGGNSLDGTSWLKNKPVYLMESGVPLNANGHSQILVGSSSCSEVRTNTAMHGLLTSAAMENRSHITPPSGTYIAPCIKRESNMGLLSQNTIADTDKRNLIDLNEALPFMDDLEMDVHEPGRDIAPNEPDDSSRDSLAVTAAEGLLAMCNDVFQLESPQFDTLHWFADLATLKENTMLDEDSDDDFEALTLKLQETKSFEYNSTSRIQEDNNNDGHCSAASLLLTRPRRGQARGRRRKKDFQKDVLPALASLPKHEVTEDLRTLGRSTPATPTKRGSRNGQQPRGKRRLRSVAVTMEEAEVSSPPVPPPLVPAELDTDAVGITRWGRTTRRCRRPRCPPENNASLRVA
ncbi:hypothetical protein ACP70R_033411 [Stipagrostis hirtigluma subsp. patula]